MRGVEVRVQGNQVDVYDEEHYPEVTYSIDFGSRVLTVTHTAQVEVTQVDLDSMEPFQRRQFHLGQMVAAEVTDATYAQWISARIRRES